MSSLQLGRLLVGPPLSFEEPTGEQSGSLGGAVVPAVRSVYVAQVTLATMAADGQSDTLADRQRIRRQLRSLLNNDQLKLGAFLYVISSDDPEQDGWWAPASGSFQDPNNGSAPATGFWQVQSQWSLLGHRRTHKAARQIWLKDLRTAGYDRDLLGWIRSTDFAALPALALNVLPNGATGAALTVSGQAIVGAPLPAGRDGGQCSIVQGLSDLQVVSYERAEAAIGLSDVIVYDRRGGNLVQGPAAFANGNYPLQATDLGVVQRQSSSTNTLPIGIDASASALSWYVKNASAATITVTTGTSGLIDNFAGGIAATSTTIVSGETGIFVPDTNLFDWIKL